MSQTPSPRQVASQWFQRVWNDHDESTISELLAPGARGLLEGGQEVTGPQEFREFFRTLLTIFPDLQIKVLEIVEEGEKAYVRWAATGTHCGEGMGLAPSDQPHSFRGITWFRVVNGQIVEGGDSWDQGGLLTRMAACSKVTPN
jgi:steroid delta-isomerase-like uncharacterized protein